MLSFFRKIRQSLLAQNKVTRYLIYALGEILLVTIGILIALQINTWNEDKKNTKRETAFLINLQEDLKADSIRLEEIRSTLKTAVSYKRVFEKHVAGGEVEIDSLNAHFLKQYNILVDFIPNSTSIDELTNGNGLNLISNPILRKKIVTLYNDFDDLIIKLNVGKDKGQLVINYVSQKVKNINSIADTEIMDLLNDRFYVNQTKMNYLTTQFDAVEQSYLKCMETMKLTREELYHD